MAKTATAPKAKPAKAKAQPKAKAARKPRVVKTAPPAANDEPESTAPATLDANATYDDIRAAFDHLNGALFAGELPVPLLTLRGVRGSKGHFAPDRYTPHGGEGATVPEIALNPETFTGRTVAEILSTLVHEMCHLWDDCYGAPGAAPYHSKSWGARMLACGLQPVTSAGAEVTCGPSLTHIIPEDARGDAFRAALASLPRAVHLWADAYAADPEGRSVPAHVTKRREQKAKRASAQRASKTKFTCPGCGMAAWAKPTASLACGVHLVPMVCTGA